MTGFVTHHSWVRIPCTEGKFFNSYVNRKEINKKRPGLDSFFNGDIWLFALLISLEAYRRCQTDFNSSVANRFTSKINKNFYNILAASKTNLILTTFDRLSVSNLGNHVSSENRFCLNGVVNWYFDRPLGCPVGFLTAGGLHSGNWRIHSLPFRIWKDLLTRGCFKFYFDIFRLKIKAFASNLM